jgi:hypothetical protein
MTLYSVSSFSSFVNGCEQFDIQDNRMYKVQSLERYLLFPRLVCPRISYTTVFLPFRLYLRTVLYCISGLSLFMSFLHFHSLDSPHCTTVDLLWASLQTQQWHRTRCQLTFLTLVHTYLTHSCEHSSSWSTLQRNFTVPHVIAQCFAVFHSTTAPFTFLSFLTRFH